MNCNHSFLTPFTWDFMSLSLWFGNWSNYAIKCIQSNQTKSSGQRYRGVPPTKKNIVKGYTVQLICHIWNVHSWMANRNIVVVLCKYAGITSEFQRLSPWLHVDDNLNGFKQSDNDSLSSRWITWNSQKLHSEKAALYGPHWRHNHVTLEES